MGVRFGALSILALAWMVLQLAPPARAEQTFVRGEVNADGEVDLSDAVSLLNYLFVGAQPPSCLDAADANDDGDVDLSDAIFALDYLFVGGRPPTAPYPECGVDPTPDPLDCRGHRSCPDTNPSRPFIVAVTAPSNHYVEATFDEPLGPEDQEPSRFVVTDTAARRLRVFRVELSDDRKDVVLTTEGQLPTEYRLWQLGAEIPPAPEGEGGGAAINDDFVGFPGSTGSEPKIVSAIALDNTSVLVTFDRTMAPTTAENVAFYRIEDPDEEPDLDIALTAATLQTDATLVVLTTTPQENRAYTLCVTNVTSQPGGKRIDPTWSKARFFGMPALDDVAPRLVRAESLDATTVLLSFSEPLGGSPANPASFSIAPDLAILDATVDAFATRITLTTSPQVAGELYTVAVQGDLVDFSLNPIDPNSSSASFVFAGGTVSSDPSTPPRVVGAISTSNTTVTVTFSKAMGDSAIVSSHYAIVQENVSPEAGALVVVSAAFLGPDQAAVELTTLSQNELTYEVKAVNVRDRFGNQLAPPEPVAGGGVLDPSTATFAGTPFSCTEEPCDLPDSDGDGLSDFEEQRGWVVTVQLENGSSLQRDVTSDAFVADTDGDGVDDRTEKRRATDPRDPDTDEDGLEDAIELEVYLSNPVSQDSDGDGVADTCERDEKTSLILADTDGDGLTDLEERFISNRNARIADLPRPRIDVGEIALRLDTRFSFTDTQGQSRTSEESVATSLTQGEDRTYAFSDTATLTHTVEVQVEAGFEVGTDGGSVSGSLGIGYSYTDERSTTHSQETTRSTSRAYENSLTTSESVDETQEVTREVVGAEMQVDVTVRNEGDIAFSISNLEISVLYQDPVDRTVFRPVATLLSNSPSDTFSLGPFVLERGPFIFESEEIFPSLVEDLMRSPRGLVFKVANFDIEDEFGRNFAFASQDVNDRTAGIVIDYGNGVTDSYRVATASTFRSSVPVGITMGTALQEILGLEKNRTTPDAITDGGDGVASSVAAGDDLQIVAVGDRVPRDGVVILPGPNGVIDSIPSGDETEEVITGYGTEVTQLGPGLFVERLERIGRIRSDTATFKAWAILTSAEVDPLTSFDDIVLQGGDVFSLAFLRDEDGDRLPAREEFLHGSSDRNRDTDGDSITDYDEVRVGWNVTVADRPTQRVFSDPTVANSDGDLLTDAEELAAGTNPRQTDTDGDRLSDYDELVSGAVIFAGSDGIADTTVLPSSDDVQVVDRGDLSTRDRVVIRPGPDGILQTVPTGDDRTFAGLSPLNPDTDGDGLLDGVEILLGADPTDSSDAALFRDSDRDGLTDSQERSGWIVSIDGGPGVTITSNPFVPDTDDDGLPDLLEQTIGSNPRDRDSDGDGLLDYDEFTPGTSTVISLAQFRDFEDDCIDAERCGYDPSSSLAYGTSPIDTDTDGDGRTDPDELFVGWTVSACVAGVRQDPVRVFSNPRLADEDLDGLGDGGEAAAHTDPLDPDTDGDGVFDGNDPIPEGCSKRVTITVLRYNTGNNDCDNGLGEGEGDFFFDFEVRKNLSRVGGAITANDISLDVNSSHTFNAVRTFTILPGDTFDITGSAEERKNPGSAEVDATVSWTLSPRSRTFANAATESLVITPGSDSRDGCFDGHSIDVTITVVE